MVTKNPHAWYGCLKDRPDRRDFTYAATRTAKKLAAKVDGLTKGIPVWNQGAEGSCTAHGTLRADVFCRQKQGTVDKGVMPSRAFQYYNTRLLEGTTASDAGGQIRDAIKALVKYGVCPEPMFPYRVGDFARKPGSDCYVAALADQVLVYRRIPDHDLKAVKDALMSGFPVVIGMLVFKQMESPQAAKDGVIAMPKSVLEMPVGGHCVLLDGYDDARKQVDFPNSWGGDWGSRGWGHLPYDYFNPREMLISDCWVISQVE